jgi:hypothetical protein
VTLVHQRTDADRGKGKQQGSPSAATPTAKHTPLVIRFEKLERSPKVQIGKGIRKFLANNKVKFVLEPAAGKKIRLDIQGGPSEVQRAKGMLQELGCVVQGHRSRTSVLDIPSFHNDQIQNLTALNEKPKAATRPYIRKPRHETPLVPATPSVSVAPVTNSQEVSEVSVSQEMATERQENVGIIEAFLREVRDQHIVFAKACLGTDTDGKVVLQTVTITSEDLGEILAGVLAANK